MRIYTLKIIGHNPSRQVGNGYIRGVNMSYSNSAVAEILKEHFSVPENAPRTCNDAATRRGITLNRELKSLVLKGREGLYAIHLPGDRKVNFRNLRSGRGKIELLKRKDLQAYGLDAAQVNPVNVMEQINSLKLVWICSSAFINRQMYTNAGIRGDTLILNVQELPAFVESYGIPCKVGNFSLVR